MLTALGIGFDVGVGVGFGPGVDPGVNKPVPLAAPPQPKLTELMATASNNKIANAFLSLPGIAPLPWN